MHKGKNQQFSPSSHSQGSLELTILNENTNRSLDGTNILMKNYHFLEHRWGFSRASITGKSKSFILPGATSVKLKISPLFSSPFRVTFRGNAECVKSTLTDLFIAQIVLRQEQN